MVNGKCNNIFLKNAIHHQIDVKFLAGGTMVIIAEASRDWVSDV